MNPRPSCQPRQPHQPIAAAAAAAAAATTLAGRRHARKPAPCVAPPLPRAERPPQPWRLRAVAWAASALVAGTAADGAWAADVPATTALPSGGQLVGGQASWRAEPGLLTVDQTSPRAAIDWQRFDIGAAAQVNVHQPSARAVLLNRVQGAEPSAIYGTLRANGQVFLLNPQGVLFAPGARVDAAGLLASTRTADPARFMAGDDRFDGSGHAAVINRGSLAAAPGGYVALVAAQVVNEGTVQAPAGEVRMAAADTLRLRIDGQSLASFEVSRGTMDALVAQNGLVRAEGGRVWLTAHAADALAKAVVNHQGVSEARSAEHRAGTLMLLADPAVGQVLVAGRLDASAPTGGAGGLIETSAAQVRIAPGTVVDTHAASGRAGLWRIDPEDFVIAAHGGTIDGATLGAAASAGHVSVESPDGHVVVDDAVRWSGHGLTLSAGQDIRIQAPMAGGSGASLSLLYGQAAPAAGNTASYRISAGAAVDLPEGQTLRTVLGHDGAPVVYQVIHSLGTAGDAAAHTLQGLAAHPHQHTALGADIDAGATAGWNPGAPVAMGFAPIGDAEAPYTGRFEGLGHRISGLTVQRPSAAAVGLFGVLGAEAQVQHLRLDDADIRGGEIAGGVAGWSAGTVRDVAVSGVVRGNANALPGVPGPVNSAGVPDLTSYGATGGVVGSSVGQVIRASASARVEGYHRVGGVIGLARSGSVSGLSGTGSVRASGNGAGGLIGAAEIDLDNLHHHADVVGNTSVGGLVGSAGGSISHASSSGTVTGNLNVGGLVGVSSRISDSSSSADVSGDGWVGGLVGHALGLDGMAIQRSQSSGRVSGAGGVGGLAGLAYGVEDSLATGDVVATTGNVGGLVGDLWGPVLRSEARGAVSGRDNVGGLVGWIQVWDVGISDSRASGAVTGTGTAVGGAVGSSVGSVSRVLATGDVSGVSQVGGLIGQGPGAVDSSASGRVSGVDQVGGLVGAHKLGGVVLRSQASGRVTASGQAVGGLIGFGEGSVTASQASGAVQGHSRVGGLVGELTVTGSVETSRASGAVSGHAAVGGLVGDNAGLVSGTDLSLGRAPLAIDSATLAVSGIDTQRAMGVPTAWNADAGGATGAVSGSGEGIGGIVGRNQSSGLVQGVLATGAVSGGPTASAVGGLVGLNLGIVQFAAAHNTVTNEGAYTGGAVGVLYGALVASHALGPVSGMDDTGGLVGLTGGALLDTVFASGTVTGRHSVGGLVGSSTGEGVTTLHRAYADGSVSGTDAVGGLIGTLWDTHARETYAAATVRASGPNVGGYAGAWAGGVLDMAGNVFDAERSGQARSIGAGSELAQARSSTQMREAGTYAGWSMATEAGSGLGWRLYPGAGTPLLSHWLAPLTIDASAAVTTVTYDGQSRDRALAVTWDESARPGHLLAPVFATAGPNVGTYRDIRPPSSDQFGWDIAFTGSAALHIVPAPLSATLRPTTKVYDGSSAMPLAPDGVLLSGFVAGEGGSARISEAQLNAASVAAAHSASAALPPGSIEPQPGTWLGNYTLPSQASGAATVTPRPLQADMDAARKVYDGLLELPLAAGALRLSGFAPGEGAQSSATTARLNAASVAGAHTATVTLGTADFRPTAGTDWTNYRLPAAVEAPAQVLPRPLSAAMDAVQKTYDGQLTVGLPDGALRLQGFVDGEGATARPAQAMLNAAGVADARSATVALSPADVHPLRGTVLGNYLLPDRVEAAAQVSARTLTAQSAADQAPVTKVYDGNRSVTLAPGAITLQGFVAGEGAQANGLPALLNDATVPGANRATASLAPANFQPDGQTDWANYRLPESVSVDARVMPKPLQLEVSILPRKADGSTRADARFGLAGVVANDAVGVQGQAFFDSAQPGERKPVTLSDMVLTGPAAANYALAPWPLAIWGEIEPLMPTLSLVLPNVPVGRPSVTFEPVAAHGAAAIASSRDAAAPANAESSTDAGAASPTPARAALPPPPVWVPSHPRRVLTFAAGGQRLPPELVPPENASSR